MKTVKFSPSNENFTPKVVEALLENPNGVNITFEKGKYHFLPDGCIEKYFAPLNNDNGIKKIVFPIIGMKNVKLDGGGAEFVFHGEAFPFIISDSENVQIGNFTITTDKLPYLLMQIGEICEDGFELKMHPDTHFKVDSAGHLYFMDTDGRVILDGRKTCFSLHSLDRVCIRYLFTGECSMSQYDLPTSFYDTLAEVTNDGVFLRYISNERASRCHYNTGENLGIVVGGRSRDVFFLSDSKELVFTDITVHRGLGMGIIGQCCHNVSVNGFRVIPRNGEPSTLTADALHFVHCTGLLDIRNCEVRNTMDDMLNVHGMYTYVTEIMEDCFKIRIGHQDQSGFIPYRNGDRLSIIDPITLNIKGYITFESFEFISEDCRDVIIRIKDKEQISLISVSDLIEDAYRMCDLNFVGNKGINIPHIRLAGGKRYYYADNYICGCRAAVFANDLIKYWYESGRLGELIIENNVIDTKGEFDNNPILRIGVDGFSDDIPPVHGRVIIRNNRFLNMKNEQPFLIRGVKELVIEGNRSE